MSYSTTPPARRRSPESSARPRGSRCVQSREASSAVAALAAALARLLLALAALALAAALAFGHAHRVGLGSASSPRLAVLRHPVWRRHKLEVLPGPIGSCDVRPHVPLARIVHLVHEGAVPVGVQPAPAHDVLHELALLSRRPVGPSVLQDRVRAVEPDLYDARVGRRRKAARDVDRLLVALHQLRQVRLRVGPLRYPADEEVQLVVLQVVGQVARILPLDDLEDCLLFQVHILPHRHGEGVQAAPPGNPHMLEEA
mmetsp:Transcript_38924/g.121280  ORF Transcript_38924/g.121280 Transcript_38924/m.121280 type:complete len:256 (+) Transcript_38924:99-866(+)